MSAQTQEMQSRLNWLRAAVLGANDGIVSTAGIVVGVSGAALTGHALLASGLAGVIAGALSMAAGEYVSVSTQRDTERAAIEEERELLAADPAGELNELTALIQDRGVEAELARRVAVQLTDRDPLAAHAHWELGIDPDGLANPWHAAFASMLSFVTGAIIPLVAILATPTAMAVPVTVLAVTFALALTGSASARLGSAPELPAIVRNVCGGLLAMGVTYAIGLAVAHLGG
ncbi:VIT family protein [Actinomycetaceae bacterium L2_0104]